MSKRRGSLSRIIKWLIIVLLCGALLLIWYSNYTQGELAMNKDLITVENLEKINQNLKTLEENGLYVDNPTYPMTYNLPGIGELSPQNNKQGHLIVYNGSRGGQEGAMSVSIYYQDQPIPIVTDEKGFYYGAIYEREGVRMALATPAKFGTPRSIFVVIYKNMCIYGYFKGDQCTVTTKDFDGVIKRTLEGIDP